MMCFRDRTFCDAVGNPTIAGAGRASSPAPEGKHTSFPPFGRVSNGRKLRPVALYRTGRAQASRCTASLIAVGAGRLRRSVPFFETRA